jgi:phosphatidylserine/phosphatidylglycerophosphate/cardiolipin synthase-like enzyme
MRVVGDGVIDLSRHFIQYWNFVLADIELAAGKENKFVLRARREEDNDEESSKLSGNSQQKVGFLNKLKKKWKNLRNSRDP